MSRHFIFSFIQADATVTQRQQINDITSYIDASNVYGSSDERLSSLRDGTTRTYDVMQIYLTSGRWTSVYWSFNMLIAESVRIWANIF
ncbi:hypothetical protein DPMN_182414 [Dreissena polymorpha]|uniref:Uncharacterized protein n=2 Tax=Dreissena polymorpha TaxID=45954 RepID=A0A9D4DFE8_DREPO|nr:hypothetical protein DPMN_182414 [Dreissena polymorpha]